MLKLKLIHVSKGGLVIEDPSLQTRTPGTTSTTVLHDDVIKWKHFPRNWPFVRGIHRSPVNSPHKGQWRGALMFTLICARMHGWVNTREAGDFRRYRPHYDVIVMLHWVFTLTLLRRSRQTQPHDGHDPRSLEDGRANAWVEITLTCDCYMESRLCSALRISHKDTSRYR